MRTLVVGAGAAGLWCALHAVDHGEVVVVAPKARDDSATAWAQGGIAAALPEGDSPDAHASDTMAAGDGLCDPAAVNVLAREAPESVEELRAMGMPFDEGGPTLEGAHSTPRVHHAGGDASGQVLLETLTAAVDRDERVSRIDGRVRAILLTAGRACGARLDDGRELETDRVVLATGGACGIYGRRTGPRATLGVGLALAWDAGAALADLEFVQFHPTAIDVADHPARLLTEALRGEGAVLVDDRGERFLLKLHPRGELAPRDVLARAIFDLMERTGGRAYLDATGVPEVSTRFPVAAAQCRVVGLDLSRDRIPIAPAAHYFTGGVLTDTWGRTTVDGLLACGEVACTGVHGANRLASNSLAEALVFGRRAAESPEGPAARTKSQARESLAGTPPGRGLPLDDLRSLTDHHLGVRRSGADLEQALKALDGADDPEGNGYATLVAWLLAQAALRREESRGGHFRSDFPQKRPEWRLRQTADRHGWSRTRLA